MSKYDIRHQFECPNRILNVKIRYSTSVPMTKKDFAIQNTIFGPSVNVNIRFLNVKITIFGLITNVKIRV